MHIHFTDVLDIWLAPQTAVLLLQFIYAALERVRQRREKTVTN